MTITFELPQKGDEVTILTNALVTVVGTFDRVTKNRTIRVFNARCENRFIGTVDFKVKDIRTMHVRIDGNAGLHADPAVIQVESYEANSRPRSWNAKNSYNKAKSGKIHSNNGFVGQINQPQQRGFQSKPTMLHNGSYLKHNLPSGYIGSLPEQLSPSGPKRAKPRQAQIVPFQPAIHASQIMRPSLRRPSEGVFPQVNPGMVSLPQEEFDFAAAQQEFKLKESTKDSSDNADDASKKFTPVYNKEQNFFDQLRPASENYESNKLKPLEIKMPTDRAIVPGELPVTGPKRSRAEIKHTLIQTFGKEIVANVCSPKDLYAGKRVIRSQPRTPNHSRNFTDNRYNMIFRDDGYGNPVFDPRNGYSLNYRPTLQFHKNYRGAHPRFSRDKVRDKPAAMMPVPMLADAPFGSLMHNHLQQLLGQPVTKQQQQLSSMTTLQN